VSEDVIRLNQGLIVVLFPVAKMRQTGASNHRTNDLSVDHASFGFTALREPS